VYEEHFAARFVCSLVTLVTFKLSSD